MRTSDGIRFVDLEAAAVGAGPVELAYLDIGFPTCWCATSLPDAVRREAIAAYRSTWRSVTGGDLEDGRLADACASWLIRGDALVHRAIRTSRDHLERLPDEDWRWGTATARQRSLHRLTAVSGITSGELAELAVVSRAMRDRLSRGWPGIGPLPVTHGDPLTDTVAGAARVRRCPQPGVGQE